MTDNRTIECECGNPKLKRAVACERCLEIERQRVKISDGHKRVVNALYSFDWCTGADLWEAMNVTGGSEGVAVSSTLANLVKSGEVEKRRDEFGRLEYRLVRKQRRAA